jgi:hypothetical protein
MLAILALAVPVAHAQVDEAIKGVFPLASAIAAADDFKCNQSGRTKDCSASQMATYVASTLAAGGSVTSASVVSANGFAGTVATPSSTPAITLSTSITGPVKGNGTALQAAAASDISALFGGASGTGTLCLTTSCILMSPTLVTPALGTPASGVATNLTGTASGLTAGAVTTNANLTGPITSTGNATAVAAQTGTGSTFVMQSSPTLTTPTLGAAIATSLTDTLETINPAYAGSGNLSNGLTFNAPSPITAAAHSFGYGTTAAEAGQLELSTNSAANAFAIEQLNNTGFATLTFRGYDANYTGATTQYEHGAIGWVPGNGGFAFFEASRFDNALNPLIPPPTFNLFQTGGVDPTGGTNYTCTTVNTNATMTCAANSTTNGQLITGTGVPTETTISSGGGTTTIVMSKVATASGSVSLNFSTPVYAQYSAMTALGSGGRLAFKGWNVSDILSIDRVNNRVGFNQPSPAYLVDVNGAARVVTQLNLSNGPLSQASWTNNGAGLVISGGPFTDTTSTGTVANESVHAIAAPTVNASSTTTITNLNTLYLNAPIAGTNVTATNLWTLNVNGKALIGNFLQGNAGINIFGGAATINVNSNNATSIGTGTTSSLVTLGGGSNGVIENGNQSGYVKNTALISTGTKFTTTGCSISATTGGATAGTFTLGANSCTAVVTMNGATGLTAPNGWTCQAHDRTGISTVIDGESSSTTTTASFVIPVTAGATDVISFSCTGY